MDYVHLLKKRCLRGKNIKSELGIMINWCHLVSKFVLLLVKEYGKPQKSSSLNGRPFIPPPLVMGRPVGEGLFWGCA